MKKISGIIIAIIAILAAPATVLAAPPSIPLLIYGSVNIDGNLAPTGTEISAKIEGLEAVVINTVEEGKYFMEIPDGKDNEGKTIIFRVNEIIVEDTNNQYKVKNINTIPSINFNLAISTVETAPAPSPSGGGGTLSAPPKTDDQDEQEIPELPKTPEVKGVTDMNILDGDIIQCQSCSDPFAVYIVKIVGNTKYIRHIVSIEIFNYYSHLKWENLKQVDSLDDYSLSGWVRYNTGANYTAAPTDKVYEINGDQTKHWINMTAEQFLSHGGSEPAIFNINQGELNLYTTGSDVMIL